MDPTGGRERAHRAKWRPQNLVTTTVAAGLALVLVDVAVLVDFGERVGGPAGVFLRAAALAALGAWGIWGPRPAWDWQAGPWGRAATRSPEAEPSDAAPRAFAIWWVAWAATAVGFAALVIGGCAILAATSRWPSSARPNGFPWNVPLLIEVAVGDLTIAVAGLAFAAAWWHVRLRVFGEHFGVWRTAPALAVAGTAGLMASAPEAWRWMGAATTGHLPTFGPWTLSLPTSTLAMVVAGLALVFGARAFPALDAGPPPDPTAPPPLARASRRWFRR